MNRLPFSWAALGLGSLIAMVVLRFGWTGIEGEQELPLLTTLFLAEFGFLVTAAGAILGSRAWRARQERMLALLPPATCGILAIGFAWVGVAIWSNRIAA
jgi:hypothetical protein